MKNWDLFLEKFSEKYLLDIYNEKISHRGATGIDNITQKDFRKKLQEEIALISSKVSSGTYNFSAYKLRLISRGRQKIPREISIPTIRDRITLRALGEFLTECEIEQTSYTLPQNIIRDVRNAIDLDSFDTFIKLDIKDYYPSVLHLHLLKRIQRKIRKREILRLVEAAIKNPTIQIGVKSASVAPNSKGIPQGISISNILALVYLGGVDKKFQASDIFYSRYVDDILILCPRNRAKRLVNSIKNDFSKVGLEVYDPYSPDDNKSIVGEIKTKPFSYLGYTFFDKKISVREKSLKKFRDGIAAIFTSYKKAKHPNSGYLLWRLNLKITGCIYRNKARGWLLFFSQMTDEALLHQLDHYIARMCKRFGLQKSPKKLVRSYYIINHRLHESNYIPNFDQYTQNKKKHVLNTYFNHKYKNVQNMLPSDVDRAFDIEISYQVKELEEDLRDFS